MTTAREIADRCRKFAEAQQRMAAKATEDFTVWHHVALAETLEMAANALTAYECEGNS